MTRFLVIFFIFFFTLNFSKGNDDYFRNIEKEVGKAQRNKQQLQILYKREVDKYSATKEQKYLVSSIYLNFYIYNDEEKKDVLDRKYKRVTLVFELLKINNNESNFITAMCYYNLAMSFEGRSMAISTEYLNKAIKIAEENNFYLQLPYFYSAKASRFYIDKDYDNVILYYSKALYNLQPDNYLDRSSMHNNIGDSYSRKNNYAKAIKEVNIAISILKSKISNDYDLFFYEILKGNLGDYYTKVGRDKEAVPLYEGNFDYYKNRRKFELISQSAENLYNLYMKLGLHHKAEALINQIKGFENKVPNSSDRINLLYIIQDYYIKKNDFKQAQMVMKDIRHAYEQSILQAKKESDRASDILNLYMMESLNIKHVEEIKEQQNKNVLTIVAFFSVIIILIIITYLLKVKRKKEQIILENNRKILEQDVLIKQERIKRINLKLNLKNQAESAFLEKLKKIRKERNSDSQEIVKDLYLSVKALLDIDKKNDDSVKETLAENASFIKKLSISFPNLTKQELNLCTYFKVGLYAKEIGILENISADTARVYKSKIRSKMNLSKEQDLMDFLNEFSGE